MEDACIKARRAREAVWGVSMALGPTLFAASTFFWIQSGDRVELGTTGGVLVVVAMVFWIFAFRGLFSLVERRNPLYAAWGHLVAVYGCIGGAAFGLDGLLSEAYNLPHGLRLQVWQKFSTVFDVVLFWPGPLFPLSVLILGALLVRYRSTTRWVGSMLCLSGILFPVGRIFRAPVIAHATDTLMLIPMAFLAWRLLYRSTSGQWQSSPDQYTATERS